jgi:hypothetical protein
METPMKISKEKTMKILSLLMEAQDIFKRNYKKPLKEIQQAKEAIQNIIFDDY